MQKSFLPAILVVLILCLSSACWSAAPAKPAAEMKVGLVDMEKVWKDYELSKKYSDEFSKNRVNKKAQLDRWDRNRLLVEEQLKELDTLYGKATPTDGDKARIKAIEDEATKLDVELKDLQAKKEPTPDEKKRLEELNARGTKMDETLQKMAEQADAELVDLNTKWSKEVKDNVIAAIQKVAEQKGIPLVFDKMVVLFGGTDLSDPVVEYLNKKK